MKPFVKKAAPLLLLYLAAFLFQSIYILSIQDEPAFRVPVVDSAVYHAAAEAISRGEAPCEGPYRYGPLYPYILALWIRLAGGSMTGVLLLQALFTSWTAPLVLLLGRRVCGETAGLVAGIVSIFYWPLVYFSGELLIEPILIPILLAGLLLLLRMEERAERASLLGAGFLLGLTAIARPNLLLVAVVFVLREAVQKRYGRALLLAAAIILPILPVTARNIVAGGDAVLISSTGGINFYIGNNEHATGRDSAFPGITQWTFDKVHRLAEIETGRSMKPSEVSRFYIHKGLRFTMEEPARALILYGKKAIQLLSSYEMPNVKDLNFYRSRSPILSFPLLPGFGVILPLALLGFISSRRDSVLPFFTAAYTVSILLFFVNARYRIPLAPVILIYGGAGLVRAAGVVRARGRGALRIAVILIPALFLVNWNPRGEIADLSQAHFTEGWAAQKAGDMETALAEYGRVSRENKLYPLALNNRAVLLMGGARVEEAMRDLTRAVTIDSTYYEAWMNIGRIHYAARRYEDAAGAFGHAVRLWPEDARYRMNHGLALKGAHDLEGAASEMRAALDLDPRLPMARDHLAEILVTLGRDDEAWDHLQALLRENRENAAAWYFTGVVHERKGRIREAVEAWEKTVSISPNGALVERAQSALKEVHNGANKL